MAQNNRLTRKTDPHASTLFFCAEVQLALIIKILRALLRKIYPRCKGGTKRFEGKNNANFRFFSSSFFYVKLHSIRALITYSILLYSIVFYEYSLILKKKFHL